MSDNFSEKMMNKMAKTKINEVPESIITLSELASKNKLVPFIGAGSSYNHLKIDWDSIAREMSQEIAPFINCDGLDNLEIAEKYVQKKGIKKLCELLEEKLIIKEYDEDLDIVPLTVLSLGVGLIYTTNQDNVFEKCIEKYGRKFKVISQLEDLSSHLPGENIFIKYHGDIENPETLIFTKSSYDKRIRNIDHFLNIRMKSDLLTKCFIFIGYSFRDPNVVQIFDEIYKAFGEKLPKSYLITFKYEKEIEILNEKYGIKIIDPFSEIPGCNNYSEAFDRYMTLFSEETYSKKTGDELEMLFNPPLPQSIKVVSKYEIAGIEKSINKYNLIDSINLFRATFDLSIIPEIFQERVVNILIELCKKCSSQEESDELGAAIFNLSLSPENAIIATAAVYTTAIYRDNHQIFNGFNPHMAHSKTIEGPYPLILAIAMIKEWGIDVNEAFRSYVSLWIEGYEEIEDDLQKILKEQIDWVWSTKSQYTHPMKQKRIPKLKTRSFDEIGNDISKRFPKAFKNKNN